MSLAEATKVSAVVGRRVLALNDFMRARTVMAYLDVRREIQTGGLIRDIIRRGRRVALPVPEPGSGLMAAVMLMDYPRGLVPGPYGIPVPHPGSRLVPPGELDCVLVPGVAFDESGYRLGYGGGYYDRFLAGVGNGVLVIGLAYAWQMVPQLPREPHDRPVDLVVTADC